MLFTWAMIDVYGLQVELGWFISSSWALQVTTLILFGFISDRFDKKKIVLTCSGITLVSVALLNLTTIDNHYQIGLIYLISSVLAIAIQPIGSSIAPCLYQDENLEKAFKVRGFVNSINMILGAAISGFVISRFDINNTLIIINFSIVASFFLFFGVKPDRSQEREKEEAATNSVKILFLNKTERVLVFVCSLSNFILMPLLSYIVPIKIIDEYYSGTVELGISESLFGVGMIVGSTYLSSKFNKWFGVKNTTVASINFLSMGLLLIVFINSLWAIYAGLFVAGLGVVIYNVNTTNIRCSATPPEMRNSFESIFLAFCIISIPLGLAFSTFMVKVGNIDSILMIFAASISIASVFVMTSRGFNKVSKLSPNDLNGAYAKMYPDVYQKNQDSFGKGVGNGV